MKKNNSPNIMVSLKKLGRPVFTTHELITTSGKSTSTIVQSLNRLVEQGLLIKIYRGIWVETGDREYLRLKLYPVCSRANVFMSLL